MVFVIALNFCLLSHSTDPGRKPVLFTDTAAALAACVQDLSGQSSIAFDLEFDSHNNAYGVTLCLIQVATPDTCYVIDPFAAIDLEAMYALFEDDRIQKLVHSPGEDLRLLHSLGCYPKNVYDTEIPARLLNYEQTSLAVMLQEKLGHAMSKKQQRSNWLRRPLSPEQIEYAAADVAWLHALKEVLEEEAAPKGLMPYVTQEQAALSTTIYKQEVKENFLKPADFYSLSPRDQYILNTLLVYRDSLAKKINKPAFQVMDETIVRELAAGTMDAYDLAEAKGVHRNFKTDDFIDELIERIERIRATATELNLADKLSRPDRLTPEQYAARETANRDRINKFTPLQEALAARFGTYAGRFIFSNTAVSELLKPEAKISGLKPYKQELLRTMAAELGIDLSGYE